jgi:hemolysin activation/secretion protein
VNRGYVTSGATIPSQTVDNGVVEMRIIEGRLEDVIIETDGRFDPGYFRRRILRGEQGPLNIVDLEKRLQRLQQDPRVVRIDARLAPAAARGLSLLRVVVNEAPWYQVAADFDNYRNPSIGALGGTLRSDLGNLTGWGDALYLRFTGSEGLRQVEARLGIPITAWDTTLAVRYQGSWAEIVDEEFAFLDIQTESQSLGFELRQPLYRSLKVRTSGFLRAERRGAKSTIGLLGIGVPTPGAEDGKSNVTVLRLGLEGTYSSRVQAITMRSILSFGVDGLGATVNPGGIPDGRFIAWLGQAQWARRLPWLDAEMLGRIDVQLANDPLLPLEQFAIGGRYTVRGYRENTLVRDNGLVGSVEARVPIYRRIQPPVRVDLVPFFDGGYAWNTDRPEIGPTTLLSVGVGTRMVLTRWGFVELFWGHRLRDVTYLGETDRLQDNGISFRATLQWP